jgi:anti-sigma regulatory factor (Ser/Thr protein kinase)
VITSGWRGPAWQVLDAEAGNVRLVRAWIRSAITRYGCPDPDDAALAVGELFGNAVRHGPGGQSLAGYCLWPGGARLVVADGGSFAVPEVQPASSTAVGGRGLQVVEAIAEQWGCFSFADVGHLVVWCDLGQPLVSHAGDAWAWLHHLLATVPLSIPGSGPVERMPGLTGAGLAAGVDPAVVGAAS